MMTCDDHETNSEAEVEVVVVEEVMSNDCRFDGVWTEEEDVVWHQMNRHPPWATIERIWTTRVCP
jgi:hypothetical protein